METRYDNTTLRVRREDRLSHSWRAWVIGPINRAAAMVSMCTLLVRKRREREREKKKKEEKKKEENQEDIWTRIA